VAADSQRRRSELSAASFALETMRSSKILLLLCLCVVAVLSLMADLQNADLQNAELQNADLQNANLRTVDLENVDMQISTWKMLP
jgi:uncharacterized protein YjbI with pentapeptide repeats